MSLESSQSKNERQKMTWKDQAFSFVSILGIESFPETPADTPSFFSIPAEALGQMTHSMALTLQDGDERAQTISWSGKTYVESNVTVGDFMEVKIPLSKLILAVMGIRIDLIDWHTHPKPRLHDLNPQPFSAIKTTEFSNADTKYAVITNGAYLDLVVTPRGIEAIVQTAESLSKPKGLIASIIRYWRFDRKERDTEVDKQAFANLLANYGLAYYINESPINSPETGEIDQGAISNGLKLKKIEPVSNNT